LSEKVANYRELVRSGVTRDAVLRLPDSGVPPDSDAILVSEPDPRVRDGIARPRSDARVKESPFRDVGGMVDRAVLPKPFELVASAG
jgi:hypothetical protein